MVAEVGIGAVKVILCFLLLLYLPQLPLQGSEWYAQ